MESCRSLSILRVFMVEDDDGVQSTLSELLEHAGGFEVVGTAATEGNTVRYLRGNPAGWDAAIVDIRLAPGSGVEVIKAARSCSRAPIVVFSDFVTTVQIREDCFAAGADAVFLKGDVWPLMAFLEQVRRSMP
jgi:DNA-binding NarL/FixJ family response regulator